MGCIRERGLISLWALAMGLIQACATTGGAGPGSADERFPPAEKLRSLIDVPPPAAKLGREVADVATWELSGPLAEAYAVKRAEPQPPWDDALRRLAERRPGMLTPSAAMTCSARELGLFILEHGKRPSPDLERFIAARCGQSAVDLQVASLSGEIPDAIDDAELAEQWRQSIEKATADSLASGQRVAGVWFGRRDGRAVWLIATTRRLAYLEPIPVVPDDQDRVLISGQLLQPTGELAAKVTASRHGTADCERDAAVKLPAFRFICEPNPDDDAAWIEVLAIPPGRLLGTKVATLLVWPRKAPVASYTRPAFTAAPLPAEPEGIAGALLAAINEVRISAGAPELTLEREQSAVTQQLAPHYFAATFGEAPQTDADLIALGLMAGWDVKGMIHQGGFLASITWGTTDLGRMLASELLSPWSRVTLLDPEARRIAIGPLLQREQEVLASLLVTYAPVEGDRSEELEPRVIEHIAQQRAERGLPESVVDEALTAAARRAAEQIEAAGQDPQRAVAEAGTAASRRIRAPLQSLLLQTESLDELTIPDMLLAPEATRLGLAVTAYRPEGAAWARYVVVIFIAATEMA